MMGREATKQHCLPTVSFANELNQVYSRFDKDTHGDILDNLVWHPITLNEEEMAESLAEIRPHTVYSPDGLRGRAIVGRRSTLFLQIN